MRSGVSWSIKNLDVDAREAAIEAARRSGLSVTEWLSQAVARLAAEEGIAQPEDDPEDDDELLAVAESVTELTRRIRAMDANARAAISGLKGRLSEIEENLGRASDITRDDRRARSLKGVSAMVDRLAREVDNADETARTQIEGQRGRAGFGSPGRRPPPDAAEPRFAPRDFAVAEPARELPQEIKLDDLRQRLNELLARSEPSRPRQPPPAPIDSTLKAIEGRLDQARARLNVTTAIPQPPAEEIERMRRIEARLADISGRLNEPEPAPEPVVPLVAPPVRDELSEAIAEIAKRQQMLDERAEAAAGRREQKKIADSIATLRTEVAGLVARVSTLGRNTAEDNEAYFGLARRIEALAAESPVDRTMLSGIRSELDALRAISETGARETTLIERFDDLARRTPDRGRFDALGEEVSALRRALETADSPKAVNRLEMRVSELGRSVEAALGSRQAAVDTSAATIAAGLADLRNAVDELGTAAHGADRDAALADMAAGLEDIRHVLDSLGDVSRKSDVKGASLAIDHIAARLDHIGKALDAREAVRRQTEDSALARLEGRFDEIAQRIDGIMERSAPAEVINGLHDRLEVLVERLDTMTARPQEAPALGQLVEEIAGIRADIAAHALPRTDFIENQIHDLGDRVEALSRRKPDTVSLDAIRAELVALRADLVTRSPQSTGHLEAEIQHLSDRVDAMGRRTVDTAPLDAIRSELVALRADLVARPPQSTEHLEAEIQDLGARLSAFAQWAPEVAAFDRVKAEVSGIRSELASRLPETQRLESQIRDLASRLESAAQPEADSRQLSDLEAQVTRLAAELEKAMPRGAALQQVEQDLNRLRTHLSHSREESVQAARLAARDVVAELAGRQPDSELVRSLRQDLDHIRAAVGDTDRRTGQNLQSLHGTLAGIVDRLAQLETEPGPAQSLAATGTYGTEKSAARVESPVATRPFVPRKAEEVAAENRLLEPGVEKPDIAALRELAANVAEPARDRGAADRRADFIAAARRAAQAADAQVASSAENEKASESRQGPFARIGQAIRGRRKPFLLAAAAIVLAIGSLYIYGPEFGARATDARVAKLDKPIPPAKAPPLAAVPAPGLALSAVVADTSVPTAKVGTSALYAPPADAKTAIALATEAVASQFGAGPAAPPAAKFSGADRAPAAPKAPAPMAAAPKAVAPKAAVAAADAAPAPLPVSAIAAVSGDSVAPGEIASVGSDKLRAAAAAGDPSAAFEIATRYAEGRGVDQNLATATEWYKHAAEGGLAVAQYRLGSLYERGQGVKKDLTAAVNWYQRAADQGNVGAMHNLAVLMSEGVDGSPDPAKALQWFLAAGNYGVKDSQYNLGVIYARAIGTQQDMTESYKWFAAAAAQGDKDAATRRDEVAGVLTPDQLTRARAAVAASHAKPLLAESNAVAGPAGGWDGDDGGVTAADRQGLVKKIQALLSDQGYDVGTPDGVAGPKTRDAVKAFQRSIGQAQTGEIDPRLVTALADKQD